MKAARKILIAMAGLVVLYLGFGFVSQAGDEARRVSLESKLRAALAIGDPHEKIERVLRDNSLSVSYEASPFSRYATRIRLGRLTNSGMLVYVDVDESKKMKKVTVQNCYTGL